MSTTYIPLEKTTDEKRNDTLKNNNENKINSVYSSEEVFEPSNNTQPKVRSTSKKTYDEKTGNTYQNGTFSKNKIDPKLSYVNVSKTGVQSTDNFLQNAGKLYNIKNEYETKSKSDPNFIYSDYAKNLRDEADNIRLNGNLSDDMFGSGVTASDVMAKINYILDSPDYKIAKSNEDFKKIREGLYNNLINELTNEEKTRAVLSYLEAQEQAKNILGPQIEQAVKDTVTQNNNEAVRRGMYGQIPASVLSSKALADVALKGQSAINDYAMNLVEADKQDVLNEYNISQRNKENKVNAWELAIQNAFKDYEIEQNYYKDLINQRNAEAQAQREAEQQAFENQLKTDEFNLKKYDTYNDNQLGWANYYLDETDTIHDNNLGDKEFTWKVDTDNRDYNYTVYKDDRDFKEGQRQFDASNAVDWYNATHKGSGGSGSGGLTYSQALTAFEKGDDSPEVISALASKNSTYNFENKRNNQTDTKIQIGNKWYTKANAYEMVKNGTVQVYEKGDGTYYYHFAGQP